MNVVDLRNFQFKVNTKYLNVPQPMYILHSTEELKNHLKDKKVFYILRGLDDFVNFLEKYNLRDRTMYAQVTDLNVWIPTGEKFVPDRTNREGAILWKLDSEGRVIPTDNCYVQLHLIHTAKSKYIAFLSSGIEILSLANWKLSAARKYQYNVASTSFGVLNNKGRYKEDLKNLLKRKRATVRDMRLVHLLLNPLSDVFLQVDKAVKLVYGNSIRKADREKVVKTERFRKLFIKELGALMSDLKLAFKEGITDKEMVEMIKEIFDKSIKTGSIDDSLKVYDAILNIRETTEMPASSVKLIKEDDDKAEQLRGEAEAPPLIEPYDENADEKPKVIKEVQEDVPIIKPEYEMTDEEKAEKKRQMNSLREETGAIDTEGMAKLSALSDL